MNRMVNMFGWFLGAFSSFWVLYIGIRAAQNDGRFTIIMTEYDEMWIEIGFMFGICVFLTAGLVRMIANVIQERLKKIESKSIY